MRKNRYCIYINGFGNANSELLIGVRKFGVWVIRTTWGRITVWLFKNKRLKVRFLGERERKKDMVRHPDGNKGKRDDRNHMGFELECWSWCFCHECFFTHKRERKRWVGSIRRWLLDKQDIPVCTWWTTTSSNYYVKSYSFIYIYIYI